MSRLGGNKYFIEVQNLIDQLNDDIKLLNDSKSLPDQIDNSESKVSKRKREEEPSEYVTDAVADGGTSTISEAPSAPKRHLQTESENPPPLFPTLHKKSC